jgi:hypothetical protein
LARRYDAKADEAVVALLVGLVIAQIPTTYVANDPRFTTIADPFSVAPTGATL